MRVKCLLRFVCGSSFQYTVLPHWSCPTSGLMAWLEVVPAQYLSAMTWDLVQQSWHVLSMLVGEHPGGVDSGINADQEEPL